MRTPQADGYGISRRGLSRQEKLRRGWTVTNRDPRKTTQATRERIVTRRAVALGLRQRQLTPTIQGTLSRDHLRYTAIKKSRAEFAYLRWARQEKKWHSRIFSGQDTDG